MKKILVPTDFSPNSKGGMRFAIQWATQQNLELVFIHVLNIPIPSRWSEATAAKYVCDEIEACRNRLKKFVDSVYKSMNVTPGVYSTILIQEYDPAKAILEYRKQDKSFEYICISTSGAGSGMKLFGTNTSGLITKSSIPVMAIPESYKPKEISSILYAADFRNYNQLAKVLRFASTFHAKVDIVHVAWPVELGFDEEELLKISGDYEYGLNVNINNSNSSAPLYDQLQKTIFKRKSQMVIMFSNKERNLTQKLFLSGNAKEFSFNLKAPLLVYSKVTVSKKPSKHELA